jgi:signal transduction histidine kinase
MHIPSEKKSYVRGFPIIEVSNLSSDAGPKVITKIDINRFVSDDKFISLKYENVLKDKAILVASIGRSLKPTIFHGDFQAFCSSEVLTIISKKEVLLPEYLITQFQEQYFIDQVNAIKRGVTIPRITIQDLLKLKLKIIPINEQQQYIADYYREKISDQSLIEQRKKEEELYNLVSRLKHSLQQPVSSIGLDINNLISFLTTKSINNSPISFDDYLVDPLPGQSENDRNLSRLSYALPRIERCISEIKETLKKVEVTINIGKSELLLESIEIKSYIENVIIPLYQNANCIIEVDGNPITLKADKYQIKELFRNFIDNAIKWGFSALKPKYENKIKICMHQITEGEKFAEIEICNNGKDFSEGFNILMFDRRGTSSDLDRGSGFGGYHIKRILENHGGYLDIDRSENLVFRDFKVRFRVYLPINI